VELERRRAQFTAELAAFEGHKKTLLDRLRKVREDAPKFEPFINEDNSWRALTYAAIRYYQRLKIKRKMVLPARRIERLRDLANALRRARHEADKAVKDDVDYDLFRAWVLETKLPRASEVALDDRDAVEAFLTRGADDLKKAVATLATLETAARKAARDVRTKRGRQRGTGILRFRSFDLCSHLPKIKFRFGRKMLMRILSQPHFSTQFLQGHHARVFWRLRHLIPPIQL